MSTDTESQQPETAPAVSGYEVTARLGADPDGVVFEGHRSGDGETVALRRLTADEASSLAGRIDALALLADPHLVGIRGIAEGPLASYLVSERVEGASLADVIDRGQALIVGQVLGVAHGVLQGLAHAHAHGVVHGRITPSAVLLGSDGRARLTDFGVGRQAPAYVAPEAVLHPGAAMTRAADVYAVAALLVHLLTGQPLSEQKRHLKAVDATLRTVLSKALSKTPGDRHSDAHALLNALGRAAKRAYGTTWWTEAGMGALAAPSVPPVVPLAPPAPPADPPRRARRGRRVLVGVVAAAVVVGGGVTAFAVLGDDPAPARAYFRTDQFCAELEDAVTAVAGTDTQSRFDSSGAHGAPTGDAATARASASCWWGGGESGTVVSISVGAKSDLDATGVTTPDRLRGLLDGASQAAATAAGVTWEASYTAQCSDLDPHGYDAAFTCTAPPFALPGKPAHPGSVRAVLVATVSDQALVCGGNRALATADDVAGTDALVAAVEELCAGVIGEVRRGG
ncbi:MAG TPA: serine/threonine-protein kinase [Nocardioides sp.]|nr:serine/threonine-protein kinase [Nocardioides sp.]